MNKEEKKEYAKKYRGDHREKSREASKKYYHTHKEEQNQSRAVYYRRKRKEVLILMGGVCFFCSKKTKRMMLHEKSGNGHKGITAVSLALKNPKDFVVLSLS